MGGSLLLETLSNQHRRRNGGRLADQVADAFTELMREPLLKDSPHTFDEVDAIGIDGQPRKIKIFPPRWIKRLEKAIEVGAFVKMEPREIAQRILSTDGDQP